MDEIKTGSLPTPENSGENSKSGEFKKYLKILKNAGRKTRVEVERLAKSGKFSEAAIAMAWEILFEYFCGIRGRDLDFGELNALAGVIQKLASGENSARKIAENPLNAADGLDAAALEQIERRLNLL